MTKPIYAAICIIIILLCFSCKKKYLSQKTLHDYVKKAKLIQPDSSSNPPFDTLKYNKVIAYDFEGIVHESVAQMDTLESFAPVILRQKSLDQKQVSFLTDFLTNIETYGGLRYGCFEPHLGIVFYQDDNIQCVINFCLDCNFLSSSVKIPVMETKVDGEYIRFGFSEQGTQNIIKLSKELGFEYGER